MLAWPFRARVKHVREKKLSRIAVVERGRLGDHLLKGNREFVGA